MRTVRIPWIDETIPPRTSSSILDDERGPGDVCRRALSKRLAHLAKPHFVVQHRSRRRA